ncbi:MAG TPA: hypothetical protein VGN34_10430 [Ktedonobacteraceae bacterium]
MTRAGIILEKEPGLKASLQGEEHPYVRCIIADAADPERHFECRILDVEDISNAIGEAVTLEVIRAITDRRSGVVRFDCRLIQIPT